MRRFAVLVFAGLVVVAPNATAVARPAGRGDRRQAIVAARGERKRPRRIVATANVSYPPSSDALTAAVTLRAPSSDGAVGFGGVAASAHTVAALSFDTQDLSAQTGVYVFGMPTGGWSSSGVPAQLTAANGQRLDPVAASDDTVVAGDASIGDAGSITALVFDRPADGWSGSLHEAATLTAPSNGSGTRIGPNVAISGPTIFRLS